MKRFIITGALAAALIIPASAQADSPTCHNGRLSDDAGLNCADGLYAATYGGGGAPASSSGICSDGVLSNDRGQGCPDGLYERVYGGSSPSSTSSTGTPAPSGSYGSAPESIAQCESGGDPGAYNPAGPFYGKWQFTDATWHAVSGLPGHASDYSEATQDAFAGKLYANGAGAGNWPVCSQR